MHMSKGPTCKLTELDTPQYSPAPKTGGFACSYLSGSLLGVFRTRFHGLGSVASVHTGHAWVLCQETGVEV